MKTLLTIVVLALAVAGSAAAKPPRPECYKRPHCKIHWVAYVIDEYGHDQYGHTYVRTCHVSARGKWRCGEWRLLRDAFPTLRVTP